VPKASLHVTEQIWIGGGARPYVFSANGAYSSQPGATPQVFFVQKINSAESAIPAWCLGLTSAVIDSRLQRLFWKPIFSWGVAPG
jgi:hypothetical protein